MITKTVAANTHHRGVGKMDSFGWIHIFYKCLSGMYDQFLLGATPERIKIFICGLNECDDFTMDYICLFFYYATHLLDWQSSSSHTNTTKTDDTHMMTIKYDTSHSLSSRILFRFDKICGRSN